MTAVLLVFQLGQPRIFFSMSRDGLLPPWFRSVHPKYRTPHVTTILTGIVVALGATLLDDDETYDLTNIGTLFAFVVYPESTPVVEAHRASLDLAAAGIPTQLVVANQVITAEQATNAFFRRRREMQQKYLSEVDRRFGVPVLEIGRASCRERV